MLINTYTEYKKALNKKIDIRIGNDDSFLTYQEFVLYYILYLNVENKETFIDPDEVYNNKYKGTWIDETWNKMSASKTHKKEFIKPWNEVF